MAYDYKSLINPERALIFRILHRDNLTWALDNGLHCGNSSTLAPGWVSIGNPDLITKRSSHPVSTAPGGFLNDYVPFYFTPFSPMLRNISTGRGGVPRRPNEEIVILVSSLLKVAADGLRWVFTDMHAYYRWANYYNDLGGLSKVDWPLLQRRDFKRDPDDPAKFERYQAEALVHRHMPLSSLTGIACYTEQMQQVIEQQVHSRGLIFPVKALPRWYFS